MTLSRRSARSSPPGPASGPAPRRFSPSASSFDPEGGVAVVGRTSPPPSPPPPPSSPPSMGSPNGAFSPHRGVGSCSSSPRAASSPPPFQRRGMLDLDGGGPPPPAPPLYSSRKGYDYVSRTWCISRATVAAVLLLLGGVVISSRFESVRGMIESTTMNRDGKAREMDELRRMVDRARVEARFAARDLKLKIREQSRREVTDKFGPGPYRVEFKLGIPNVQGTSRLTVETAPLDLMPHSVNLFLQQVSSGVWDGTEIFKNRQHILLARDFDHSTGRDKMPDLVNLGVAKLAFREHTDEYPHDMYTLGFAGRPGGPNFYINKMDNHQWHGPGPDDGDEGDPCFATVVEGRDVVDLMGALPAREEDGVLMETVLIRRATILTRGADGTFDVWSRRESSERS